MAWFIREFLGCDTHLQPWIAVNNLPTSLFTVKLFVNISQDMLSYIFIILLYSFIIYYVSRQQNKPTLEYVDSKVILLHSEQSEPDGRDTSPLPRVLYLGYIYINIIVYVYNNIINCRINIKSYYVIFRPNLKLPCKTVGY